MLEEGRVLQTIALNINLIESSPSKSLQSANQMTGGQSHCGTQRGGHMFLETMAQRIFHILEHYLNEEHVHEKRRS